VFKEKAMKQIRTNITSMLITFIVMTEEGWK
jgi:acyl-CoA hydrolase